MPNTAAEAAAHWRALAATERRGAERERERDPRSSVASFHARADMYDRTARALELEAETGKPHCSECLQDHPNHEHRKAAK